jgi:hypothetical protein
MPLTKPPSKKTFAASCGLPVAPTKLPPLPRPEGALIERTGPHAAVSITELGCDAVKAWATCGATQGACAAELGIALRVFSKLMGAPAVEPTTPLRLAWEAGYSVNESNLIRSLNILALNGNLTAQIVLLKMVHDRRDAGPMVTIENGPRINIIPPSLPGSYTEADYEKMGVPIIESRSNKTIREHYTIQGKSVEDCNAYLLSIGRPLDKDYEPKLIELNPMKMIAIPGDEPRED